TGDEISDGGRDEDLSRAGRGRHPRPDRDRDARELAVVELALARVHAGAQLEPDPTDALDDGLGTANRPSRPVEGGEEAVAGRVLLLAAVARQLASNERVMLGERLAPRAVAELGGAHGRADDVGEEEGREHRVRHYGGASLRRRSARPRRRSPATGRLS